MLKERHWERVEGNVEINVAFDIFRCLLFGWTFRFKGKYFLYAYGFKMIDINKGNRNEWMHFRFFALSFSSNGYIGNKHNLFTSTFVSPRLTARMRLGSLIYQREYGLIRNSRHILTEPQLRRPHYTYSFCIFFLHFPLCKRIKTKKHWVFNLIRSYVSLHICCLSTLLKYTYELVYIKFGKLCILSIGMSLYGFF